MSAIRYASEHARQFRFLPRLAMVVEVFTLGCTGEPSRDGLREAACVNSGQPDTLEAQLLMAPLLREDEHLAEESILELPFTGRVLVAATAIGLQDSRRLVVDADGEVVDEAEARRQEGVARFAAIGLRTQRLAEAQLSGGVLDVVLATDI